LATPSELSGDSAHDEQRKIEMSPTTDSNVKLPASLHTIYQHYKAGTTTIIAWLQENALSKHAAKRQRSENVIVPKIVDLAQKAVQRKAKPSQHIFSVFKSVLWNRRNLTKHYDQQHDASLETRESTECHKHFNDALAQAYDILFPPDTRKDPEQPTPTQALSTKKQDTSATSCQNRFEALSGLIEQEPEFECLEVQVEEKADTQANSELKDDPMAGFIAMHAYVTEVESTINRVSQAWVLAAEGQLPIPAAGCLTKLAFDHIIVVASVYGPLFDYHEGLEDYPIAKRHLLAKTPTERSDDSATAASHRFRGFCVGGNDLTLLGNFARFFLHPTEESKRWSAKYDDQVVGSYLESPSAKRAYEHEYVRLCAALSGLSADSDLSPPTDHQAKSRNALLLDHYQDELNALGSSVRSVLEILDADHPRVTNELMKLYTVPGVDSKYHIFQDKTYVPLLRQVKDLLRNTEARSDLLFGVQSLSESTRAFTWHGDTINPTNLQQQALAFASEVHDSVQGTIETTKNGTLDGSVIRLQALLSNLTDLLELFRNNQRVDMYYQSPWVSGTNITAILGHAQLLGGHLL
jgi:hypothetical protein